MISAYLLSHGQTFKSYPTASISCLFSAFTQVLTLEFHCLEKCSQ